MKNSNPPQQKQMTEHRVVARGAQADAGNQVGIAPPRTDHSVESITSTISKLETLQELLPAAVRAPNITMPPHRTSEGIGAAIDMLKSYRRVIEREAEERRKERDRELIQTIYDNGVKHGIEAEQKRAKEARKTRRNGAKR